MISTLQSIIIALLVGCLVGIAVVYILMQARIRRQSQALKASQRQLEELERSHEARLRETTQQLRRDYEVELAQTIEHYQDELSATTLELQQTHETRLKVLQGGLTDTTAQPSMPTPHPQTSSSNAVEAPLSRPEILHLKQQYEMRLKEAAQRLQHAYEKQLAQRAKTVKAELEAEYEARLAEKTKYYDELFTKRQAELEASYQAIHQNQAVLANDATLTPAPPQTVDDQTVPNPGTPAPTDILVSSDVPTPSQIMGTGDETTVTLQPWVRSSASPPPPSPSPQITREDLDERIQEATQQIRQDYEQQLSAKLKDYKDQLTARVRELEEDYRKRLNVFSELQPETPQPPKRAHNDDLDPLDLSDISQLT